MFRQGMKIVAGVIVAAIAVTTVPADVFAATEDNTYMWDMSARFSAGAHHAIEETIVLNDAESDILASGVVNGEAPLVTESEGAAEENVVNQPEMKRIATVICAVDLNFRSEPSTSSRVLAAIMNGRRVIVLDESNPEWLQIQYKDQVGYISAKYATVVTEAFDATAWEAEQAAFDAEQARRDAEAAERRKKAAAEAEARRKQLEEEARKNYVPPTGGTGQDVVNYAVQFVGYPYVLGGSSLTGGIDCSNFVMRVYEPFGVTLPHNSYQLRSVGYAVSASEIQPGDIVCYEGHVAIYIGDGKIVHASNRKDGIKISPKWNYTKVITIRRIF